MIIKQLTIENFGIYQGRHEIDLRVNKEQPIILFGGLNGGGKTTFLDALQLVLYGKHAKCSNRGQQAYGSYLASTKNRYSDINDMVELSLTFSHTTDTHNNEFCVIRSWNTHEAKEVKDKVTVYCNGDKDHHISQFWDEFVNEFIPLSLSDLFFFDGEKIENLAHPERSTELIRTGIENLLGLDLLSQLHLDLNNIERKRKNDNLDSSVINKVAALEVEISEQTTLTTSLKNEITVLEQKTSDVKIGINKSRQKIRNAGAHLIDQRDNIKFELGVVEERLNSNLVERVRLDSGCGPLGLITDLIAETKNQIALEAKANQARLIGSAIEEYELTIISTLKENGANDGTMIALEQTMLKLATERKTVANQTCYINSDINIFNGLDEKIANDEVNRKNLIKERIQLLEKKALFDKKIESIPDYETVQHLLSELAGLEFELKSCVDLIKQKKHLLSQAQVREEALNTRYTNLLTQQSKDTFEQKRAIQVAEHIARLKATMLSFSQKLINENIQKLEFHIQENFHDLTRKIQLVKNIRICPASFEISLIDANDTVMPTNRLSAGERQLLAIAVLWGLAEASGKEIPTVIDTPLGRLDGEHRGKLIKNYFPFAGKQVILLSTDEEITGKYYMQLKPSICREFYIFYDEMKQTSTITEGYFQ